MNVVVLVMNIPTPILTQVSDNNMTLFNMKIEVFLKDSNQDGLLFQSLDPGGREAIHGIVLHVLQNPT